MSRREHLDYIVALIVENHKLTQELHKANHAYKGCMDQNFYLKRRLRDMAADNFQLAQALKDR